MKHSLRHHRKLVKAGPEAAWLFVCLVLWSDEQGQDGLIDAELVQSIAVAGGMKPSRVKPATERLYAVGLLDPEPPNYRIHDYHDHQRTAAEAARQKELARERKRAERERASRNGHA
jgi:hypothetical protein